MSAVTQATLPRRPQQMDQDRISFNFKNPTADIFKHEEMHKFLERPCPRASEGARETSHREMEMDSEKQKQTER